MAKDKVSSVDYVEAGLAKEVVAPLHPCPLCGRGMKDANTKESKEAGDDLRICSGSRQGCPGKANWASGKAVLIDQG